MQVRRRVLPLHYVPGKKPQVSNAILLFLNMDSGPENVGEKRKRSSPSPPWQQRQKQTNSAQHMFGSTRRGDRGGRPQNDQIRLNQIQDDERMRQWVSQEDDFVLKQAKKKAEIRIREGRPKPIDWLCRTLRLIDTTRDPLDDEPEEEELEFVEPNGVLEDLTDTQLAEVQRDIDTYMGLEKLSKNVDFWRTMKILCTDYAQKRHKSYPEGRTMISVSSDIDRLLSPKSFEELEKLEGQIRMKLSSKEPIDTDYWQQLLDSLLVWKAKAKLKRVSESVLASRVQSLKREMEKEASALGQSMKETNHQPLALTHNEKLDPDPFLQLRPQDKILPAVDESVFLASAAADRRKIRSLGYVPAGPEATKSARGAKADTDTLNSKLYRANQDSDSQTTSKLYNKELARGFGEDEEIFTGEEEVETKNKDSWMNKHRPRKPKYFNRVQMGYEWNKYNQTHYDHDNPPPKVVQGYKFHIFYPDLIDKTKAPTYKIEREDGRKKGQSSAPAGEEDTCIIKFIAGPPYETIAFRIVDRDWDYSAKYERGFKSTFESPGILTLNFSFKKVYYRK